MPAYSASRTLLASAARTATTTTDVQNNPGHQGLHVIIDLTVLAATETVTPAIQAQDPASGKWYVLLTGAAISSVSTVVLKVFPAATAAANLVANDFLPAAWRVVLTHSSTGSHTYSVGVNLLGL